jgi:hypothetical protein
MNPEPTLTPEARERLRAILQRLAAGSGEGFAVPLMDTAAEALSLLSDLEAAEKEVERLREGLARLKPWLCLNVPTLIGADDEEGEIPESAEIGLDVREYGVDLIDWMDGSDGLTVGDLLAVRQAAALLEPKP